MLRSLYRTTFVLLLILPAAGCLFRSRKVERVVSPVPLKTATQQHLIEYINGEAAKVNAMQATVDIDTTVGGAKKGKVTEYQQIRGYVLARKPSMLRMIGLMPVVRNRAFDMVSNGTEFMLSIPPKNRFLIGRNDAERPDGKQPLENLRPQHIYDALLLREIDAENEIAVLENDAEIVRDTKGHQVEQADYDLHVVRKGPQGWFLSRRIIFSRSDLLPHRQLVYDERGNVATDAHYEDYRDFDGVSFPYQIEIRRPQEEYDIVLTMVKLQLNVKLTDDQFVLEKPPGAEVVRLGSNASPSTDNSASAK
jgi:outer membrane lipoprotein-sorting protein